MYFGSPVAGPFTVGANVLPLILCWEKKILKKIEKSVRGHFPVSLKPDAVLHSLKPQSTLQRGETKWQSPWKCIMWTLESLQLSTQPHCLTKQY